MGNNRFTTRVSPKEKVEYDLNKMLINIMRDEYPDDILYKFGKLTATEYTRVATDKFGRRLTPQAPEIQLEERNDLNILTVESGSGKYVEYTVDKTYPTVSERYLDRLLDDEWNYFVEREAARPAPENGLFLINNEIELNPIDFHYGYIARGPSRIQERINDGEPIDDVIRTTFCVFYVENNVALPIPNYQTLEVLLVERGLRYDAIREATAEQVAQFDMSLDGVFTGDRTATRPANPLEEFEYRQLLDRNRDWNYRVRYESGYEPKAPFERDPGDYLKPANYRGTIARSDLYVLEDPNDLFFDLTFQKQTYKEKLREKYEGKMIIGLWPVGGNVFDQNYVDGFTTDNIADGLIYQVRMMINGFWKQVLDDNVFRLYASINNLDIARLAARFDSPYTNIIDDSPAGVDFISGPRGFINLLVEAGGIEPLQGFDAVWNDFPHIVEVDRLDIDEYKQYIDNYSNSNNVFDVDYLKPYEPIGSTAYYTPARILALQRQVQAQAQVNSLRESIQNSWVTFAAEVANLALVSRQMPPIYETRYNETFGSNSGLFKIINTLGSKYKYVFAQNRDSSRKTKDSRSNILEIYDRYRDNWPDAITNIDASNQIVGISKWGQVVNSQQYPVSNAGKNELPRDRDGNIYGELLRDIDYINGMIQAELNVTLIEIDLYNRARQADNLIFELREAIDEASDFVIEIDNLLAEAETITEFQDIYTRITALLAALTSFKDDGMAFCDQVRIDTEAVFKNHLDRLYKGIQYFRQLVNENVETLGISDNADYGIEWSLNASILINQYLPGKVFDNYLPNYQL